MIEKLLKEQKAIKNFRNLFELEKGVITLAVMEMKLIQTSQTLCYQTKLPITLEKHDEYTYFKGHHMSRKCIEIKSSSNNITYFPTTN